MALTKKRTAATFMIARRPKRSAIRPALIAPAAAPSSAEATAKPRAPAATSNCFWTGSTAPLMTALS